MSWLIRLDPETVVHSDDFTLDDLIAIEKECQEPWGFMMPLREIKTARAYIRCALRKVGRDPKTVDGWTLKELKHVFDWVPEPEWPPSTNGEKAESEDDADPLAASTDQGSSSGAPGGSTGRRKRQGSSVSAT